MSAIGPRLSLTAGVCLSVLAFGGFTTPAPAEAFTLKPICGAAGLVSGLAGKACSVVQNGGRIIGAGKKLLGGHVGGAAQTLLGDSSAASNVAGKAAFVVGLAAVGAWVTGGAKVALKLTAKLIDHTTRPQLRTTWFSATYWRIAGIAAVLTLPFLFAAAVQSLLRADLALLLRSALGYLPVSLLAVSLAAPITMLLLAICDGMSAAVASASGGAGTHFLTVLGGYSGGLSLDTSSPFVTFFVGLMVVGAAILLWVEMLMRDAAIYIVVLMLPLVFAGFVWPARRVWAIRTIELLFALILSKFAIVCVLALGGSALGQAGDSGPAAMLIGLVLVSLAALAPWALVRLLPMAELASGAGGQLRSELPLARAVHRIDPASAEPLSDWATSLPSLMNHQADEASGAAGGGPIGSETEKLRRDRRDTTGDEDLRPSSDPTSLASEEVPVGHGTIPGAEEEAATANSTKTRPPADTPERQPGMAAGYQQSDMSWPTVMLGAETRIDGVGGLSAEPRPIGDGRAGPSSEPQAPHPAGPDPASEAAPGTGAEDHHPLPPTQDPENGHL